MKKILVAGPDDPQKCTENCVDAAALLGLNPFVSLDPAALDQCGAVIFPGGFPDIAPSRWGEAENGSRDVDPELDRQQLEMIEGAIARGLPLMGICRGMQLLNVYFGGSLIQHIRCEDVHRYVENTETVHDSVCTPGLFLHSLYGDRAVINTKHHQAVRRLADGFSAAQTWFSDEITAAEQKAWLDRCGMGPSSPSHPIEGTDDCIIEAIVHRSLPVFGLQWHPENMVLTPTEGAADAELLFRYFVSLMTA